MMASAASGDPTPRPTPEAPLNPTGSIYNEDIAAHLPPDLTGADRATVRYVMLKIPPAGRRFIRWVGRGNDLIIYLAGPPEGTCAGGCDYAYGDLAKSFDSNTLYNPKTGETFAGSAGGVGGWRPREAVRLERVPPGWKLHTYVPAPRNPAPLANADIDAYLPAGLTSNERRDVENQFQYLPEASRRWIRWDYPPQSPPRSEHPAFGFVVYEDDPYDPYDAPNVCYPNLALGSDTTQYWCPYYREALVDPTPGVIGRAADASDYWVYKLDPHKVAKQRPPWVAFPYTPPPLHPQPLTDSQIAGYIPRDLPPKEAAALRGVLIRQPPTTRRWFRWANADVIGPKCRPTCKYTESTAPAGREFVVFFDSVEIILNEMQVGASRTGLPPETAVGPEYCMQNLVGPPGHYYCPYYHKVVIWEGNALWDQATEYLIPLVPKE